jgi:hypothetical protein
MPFVIHWFTVNIVRPNHRVLKMEWTNLVPQNAVTNRVGHSIIFSLNDVGRSTPTTMRLSFAKPSPLSSQGGYFSRGHVRDFLQQRFEDFQRLNVLGFNH